MKNTSPGIFACALLAFPLSAQAQIRTPADGSRIAWRTDSLPSVTTPPTALSVNFINAGAGIGFDTATSGIGGRFSAARTEETAQSVFNSFRPTENIRAGAFLQIGVWAYAKDRANPNAASTVTVYASIFEFEDQGTGNVPLGDAILSNLPIVITSTAEATITNGLFYTDPVALPETLSTSQRYVLGFTPNREPGDTDTANAAVLSLFPNGTPSGANSDEFKQIYFVNNNEEGDAVGGEFTRTATTGPIAYRITVVPGPAALPLFGAGVSVLFGALSRRRRR